MDALSQICKLLRSVFSNIIMNRLTKAVQAGCLLAIALVSVATNAALLSGGFGEISSIVYLDSNVALAGAEGAGVFVSQDQGATWARSSSFPYCSVKSLARVTSTTAYAAADCGLYKSVDAGVTWVKIFGHPSRAINVSPSNASLLLVGVTGVGVFRSADGGASFSDASSGLDSTDVRAIAFDPTNANIVYAGLFNPDWYPPNQSAPLALGGVFRSIDAGLTWSNFNQPGGVGSAISSRWVTSVAVNSSGVVFATTAPSFNPSLGTVQRFTGTAASGNWEGPSTVSPSESGVYGAYTVVPAPASGEDVWVGSDNLGPYVWKQSNNELRRQMDGSFTADGSVLNKINAIAVAANSATLVGVAGIGVYRSSVVSAATGQRGFSPWVLPSTPTQADRARTYVRNPVSGDTYIGVAGGGVLRALNASQTYSSFNAGFAHIAGVANVFATPTISFLAATAAGDVFGSSTGRGVFRSPSGASAWSALTTSNWSATGLAPAPANNEVYAAEFFASGFPGVLKIPATGAASLVVAGWQAGAGMGRVVKSNTGLPKVYALAVDSAGIGSNNNSAGYVLPSAGGVTPMVPMFVGFQRLGFYALAENGATVIAASLKGLFRSADSGATFARVSTTGLPSSGIVGLTMVGGVFFAATRSGGVFCSTDVGATWQTKSVATASGIDLVSDNSGLYLITDGAGVQSLTASCP